MPWTEQQQQVIDERDKTILVSAAAGSGKTATLVERIFQKVTDEKNPSDINDFLVVTFTKAAAAQMKEKLMKKMEEAQEKNPESEHIAKQNILIQSADITTIDSFCLNIVKEYFSFLDLDPSIGIGDPGMLSMLQYDVLNELFEKKYRELQDGGAKEFAMLLDLFGDGRKDEKIKTVIERIYKQMSSFPDPERFLTDARNCLEIHTSEELNHAAWMQDACRVMHRKAKSGRNMAEICLTICQDEDGPEKYESQIQDDIEKLQKIAEANTYNEMKQALESKWTRLSTKKGGDPELVELCRTLRQEYKDAFDLKKITCFRQTEEMVLSDMQKLRNCLLPFLDLTEEFVSLFMKEKKKRKMLEFSDISHMAYQLVCAGYDADGNAIPTEIGKTISKRYKEIYIDEYQDSNYLQEDILTAVSGKWHAKQNMFMVGDVKQSIYRFRMARPEIFVKKYNRYQKTGSEIKIELNHNFRSRPVVLDVVNYFFYQLMGEDLGGIAYDKSQALMSGKEFPNPPENVKTATDVELLVADTQDMGTMTKEAFEKLGAPDKDTLEGYMIANRIHAMMTEKFQVYDEEAHTYRMVRYKDIVILARSLKNYGDSIYNALTSQGIPVYLEKSQGYFQAVEIQVIMSMLAVIDNSRQDIPLSAVLLSPIGQLTESELALICDSVRKEGKKNLCLYEVCEYYMETWEETDIARKLQKLFALIAELKSDKAHLSVSDLIWKLLQKTGYYEYVTAMPAGEIRKTNVDMLLEKAVQFENGYYKGLFHFLQYVEKLKLMEKDEGEASALSEDADVVRIMSIHKSKGLEYPVVFVAGLGKQFNRMELRENVQVHPDYYLASMAMYPEARYRHNTAIRGIYGMLENEEMMSENMRVLYVAMTRAKEKLILTAGTKKIDAMLAKYSYLQDMEQVLLPYTLRSGSDCYLSQILACMVRYDTLGNTCHVAGKIRMSVLNTEKILCDRIPAQISRQIQFDQIERLSQQIEKDAFYERNADSFSFVYPYEKMTEIPMKLSISDIKKMKAYDGNGYDIATEFSQNEKSVGKQETEKQDKTYKQTIRKQISGAEYGTIVHKFMELFPFEEMDKEKLTQETIKEIKQKRITDRIFDADECQVIRENQILKFLQSELGCRMIKAARSGELFKERQFSASIPVSEVYPVETDEILVVQGIIDAYFYEDDAIVIMDYKTDATDEETLKSRYRAQLASYAEVTARLTGKKVKEQIIYSFHLNKMIEL